MLWDVESISRGGSTVGKGRKIRPYIRKSVPIGLHLNADAW